MNSYFNRKDLKIKELSLLMCSGVYKMPTLKKFIDLAVKMGYTAIYIELSGNMGVEEYPYYNYMLSKYTHDELREIDRYCLERNIEFIPNIQSLGHFYQLTAFSTISPMRRGYCWQMSPKLLNF